MFTDKSTASKIEHTNDIPTESTKNNNNKSKFSLYPFKIKLM